MERGKKVKYYFEFATKGDKMPVEQMREQLALNMTTLGFYDLYFRKNNYYGGFDQYCVEFILPFDSLDVTQTLANHMEHWVGLTEKELCGYTCGIMEE